MPTILYDFVSLNLTDSTQFGLHQANPTSGAHLGAFSFASASGASRSTTHV